MGTLLTFYSYKGGVGRTMALANIAALLAMWNKRVLVVDWDLEAPGVEHFFFKEPTELKSVQQKPGLIDLLTKLAEEADVNDFDRFWSPLLIETPIEGSNTRIQVLTAGARSDGYFRTVRKLDVKSFYEERNGGHIIEGLRKSWKSSFDFVLVDSRTGITDIGGICTIQLPDILAVVFTATEQSLIGAVEVASKAAIKRQELPFERSLVPVLPIPSRFDTTTEHSISRVWLERFEEALIPLYRQWLPKDVDIRRFLELTKIPYKTYFSFGEKLPVAEEETSDPTGLRYAYESVAALIGNKLQNADLLISNRDELLQLVHAPNRLPKLPLRDLPWSSVAFIDFVGSSAMRAAFEQKKISKQAQEEIIGRYQSAVADNADEEAGELVLAKGDNFLFAFQEPEQALAFGIAIQESLAIKMPIVGPLGPLRVRIAVHASRAGTGMQGLLENAYKIVNNALEGQVLTSEETVQRLRKPLPENLQFERLESQLELDPIDDATPSNLFEVRKIISVTLTPEEHKALGKQEPASRSGGGFQAFLVDLQERVEAGRKVELTVRDRERIARYAHDYKGGGWQGRLVKIFGRSLGPSLGRETP